MSFWGIVLMSLLCRAELVDTLLSQFGTCSWTAVFNATISPADSACGRPLTVSQFKLNRQNNGDTCTLTHNQFMDGTDRI
jgi:hypothetical protein